MTELRYQFFGMDGTYSFPGFLLISVVVLLLAGCNESGVVDSEAMPEVTQTIPDNQAEEVPTNSSIEVRFNKNINPSTISSSSFMLMQDQTAILGIVSSTDTSATFTPLENLSANATYTATVTTNIEDMSGNNLIQNHSWTFHTASSPEDTTEGGDDGSPDNTAPIVQSTDPANHETEVPLDTPISASFSEEMSPSTLNSNTFRLRYGTTEVSGSIEYQADSSNTVLFIPSSELPTGNTFTASITTGVEDVSGNPIEENYQWTFTTVENIDETPPQIVSTSPEDDEDDIERDVVITVTFDEEMDPSTINESTFQLEWNWWGLSQTVSGSIEYEDNTAIFTPDEQLADNRIYTATVTGEVQDASGNSLENGYEWRFRTIDD